MTLMVEEKITKSEPQKAPYVTPKILTLKVDLSFASSATNLADLIDLLDRPGLPLPAKTETPSKAKTAVVGEKSLSPHP
jgi:hypothetical protein